MHAPSRFGISAPPGLRPMTVAELFALRPRCLPWGGRPFRRPALSRRLHGPQPLPDVTDARRASVPMLFISGKRCHHTTLQVPCQCINPPQPGMGASAKSEAVVPGGETASPLHAIYFLVAFLGALASASISMTTGLGSSGAGSSWGSGAGWSSFSYRSR